MQRGSFAAVEPRNELRYEATNGVHRESIEHTALILYAARDMSMPKLPWLSKLPPRRRKLVLWAFWLLFAYTVLGFLVLPPIIKSVAAKKLTEQLGRPVSIAGLRLDPYTLSVTIRGFLVREPTGEAFVSWDRLYVNLQLSSIFLRAIALKEFTIEQPYANVVVNKDGSYNFSDILAKAAAASAEPKPKEPSKPPTIRIGKFQVAGAKVDHRDLSRKTPFAQMIGPVNVNLEHFSTRPDNKNPYAFTATTESGEKLAYSGYFYLEPIRSGGEFSLENISLKKYAPYYDELVRFAIRDGVVDVRSKYQAELSAGVTIAYVTNATVTLRSFKIAEKGSEEDLIDIAEVKVEDTYADAVAMVATVGSVSTRDSRILLRRLKNGSVQLLTLLQPVPGAAATNAAPEPAATAPAQPATNAPTLKAEVRRIVVNNYAVTLEDASNPRPVKLVLDQIAATVTNVTLAPGTNIGVNISLRWNQKGEIKVDGTVSLTPLQTDLHLALKEIELRPVDPYLDPFLSLLITEGGFGLDGRVTFAMPDPNQPPDLRFQGDVSLDRFATVDAAFGEDFLKWQSLQISKLDVTLNPLAATIGGIALTEPYVHVVIATNSVMNLLAILKKEAAPAATNGVAAAEPAPVPTTTSAPLPRIVIGGITLTNGVLAFHDKSLKPTAAMSVKQLNVSIGELNTEQLQKARLSVTASVDGSAPVTVTGDVAAVPKHESADIAVTIKDIDLTPLGPYSGKYLGHALSKGLFSLDVKYVINERKLDAKNLILIDQFTFGEKVDSPDATKLPVGLAIAILKDRNGRITLDVPIQGSLDDPKFRVGKVVMQTLLNILVKAATSPFSLLGAAFGGGEELSYQEFPAGTAQLQTNEVKKLDVLVKALSERPALNLEIQGCVDEEKDREALRRAVLEARLRTMKLQELRNTGQAGASLDKITLTADEYARYLKAAYLEASVKGGLAAPPSATPEATPAESEKQAAPGQPARDVENQAAAKRTAGSKPWNVVGKERIPAAQPKGPVPASAPAQKAGAVQPSPPQDPVAAMARPLLDAIEISADDFRLLASERAKRVREYVLQSGKVEAARLFVTETSAELPPNKGTRVQFSLK